MKTHRMYLAAAALVLAACDNPADGGGGDGVRLRFGLAESQALASGASYQTSGDGQLVITGANGTLRIDDLRLVVAEFEVDGDDDVNPCGQQPGAVDDCEDFDAGPMFVDLPLTGGPVAVGSGNLPAGVYEEVEFEVEDLDDDEEDAAERTRIEQLRQQILAQFPDWPRDASILVIGSFTPTGGAPVNFRAFVEAEIEIETELNPPLVVGDGEARSVDVLVDPAAIFRSGGNVLNLSQPTGRLELETRIRNGFRGRGSDDD